MFTHDLTWLFPAGPGEAAAALREGGARLHAGGTLLVRLADPSVKSFVDLSQAGLSEIIDTPGLCRIGSAVTISRFLESPAAKTPGLELPQNLLQYSAATPLRNRISFGGSLAAFLPWSDLWPALLCLSASLEVLLPTGEKIVMSCEDYAGSPVRREPHLIKELSIIKEELLWFSFRATRTTFDFPVFSLAFAARFDGEYLSNVRLAVSGTRGSVARLHEAEDILEQSRVSAPVIAEAVEKAVPGFASDSDFSAEYKTHWFKTVLTDNFRTIQGKRK